MLNAAALRKTYDQPVASSLLRLRRRRRGSSSPKAKKREARSGCVKALYLFLRKKAFYIFLRKNTVLHRKTSTANVSSPKAKKRGFFAVGEEATEP
jgi:hypothetical protein